MDGIDVCCNDDQIDTMYINFATIDALFGDCEICTVNLKKMWCEFTCNPYQKYFIDYTGLWEKDDIPDFGEDLANITYRMGSDAACDLYNACKKNPFVASLASGQSAPGFLQFMGTNSRETGKTNIRFEYCNDEDRCMTEQMYPCDL